MAYPDSARAGFVSRAGIRVSERKAVKFAIIHAIRAAGLLKAADTCKFWLGRAKTWRRNRDFHALNPDFATPPPHLAFDALNHYDWERYRDSGLCHARLFARNIIDELPQDFINVLEWGCGPGRLIRHMPALLASRNNALTGSDYNSESIEWCRQHLAGIEFVVNELNPPLPFPDETFDAIYTFSVFTHLSESVQLAWARELHRVLRPGGLLLCTTHGDAYRYLLANGEERDAYNAGKAVVQGNYQEGRKWYSAIHPPHFVREHLLSDFFDVRQVPVLPEDDLRQDVWAARKAPR